MSRVSLVAVLAVATVIIGCSKESAAPGAPAVPARVRHCRRCRPPKRQRPASSRRPRGPAAPPKPVPAELPDVLARVNGDAITKAEFERAIADHRAARRRAAARRPARSRSIRGLLDQLVGIKLLKQEAAARKIVVPDAEVDARIDEIKKQFPSEDVFTQMLATQKMTLARPARRPARRSRGQPHARRGVEGEGDRLAGADRHLLPAEPRALQAARAGEGQPHPDLGAAGRRRGGQGGQPGQGRRRPQAGEGRQGLRGAGQGALAGSRQRRQRRRPRLLPPGTDGGAVQRGGLQARARRGRATWSRPSSASTSSRSWTRRRRRRLRSTRSARS